MTSIALGIDTLNLLEKCVGVVAWEHIPRCFHFISHFPQIQGPLALVRVCPLFQDNPLSIMSQHKQCLLHGWNAACSLWPGSHNFSLFFLLYQDSRPESGASPNPSTSRQAMCEEVLPLKGFLENHTINLIQYLALVLLHYV